MQPEEIEAIKFHVTKPAERDILQEAVRAVLADHDERVRIYGERESQPARIKVMENLRIAERFRRIQEDTTS